MAEGLTGARDWIGEEPWPWPAVEELDEGAALVACYTVTALQPGRTRHDKPFLRLRLADRHGPVEARVWEDAERIGAALEIGTFIGIRGRVEVFNGARQVNVDAIRTIRVEPDELELFMPCSPRDPEEMDRELRATIERVDDAPLRTLLKGMLGPRTDTGQWFRKAPAAKYNHHASVGGLLEHTLSVTRICRALAEHYGPVIDRDLLTAGALLHDIGKVDEIAVEAGFPYTDRGKLLGHIVLGMQRIVDAARDIDGLTERRLDLLLHLVASHQGRYEWQSPREPHTLEALLLHHVDDTDAKMKQAIDIVQGSGTEPGWTEYSRSFRREFLRHGGTATETTGDEAPRDPSGRPDPDTLSLFPE